MRAEASPFFFFNLFMALALAILYSTITNMAGLYIASELGGSPEISVYSMVFFGLGNVLTIPLTQLLADRIGVIRLLVYGLLLYTLFSFLCSLAPTFLIFNIFRFCLGLSSGIFFVLCRRILLTFSPPEKVESLSFLMLLSYTLLPILGVSFGAWLAYESFWRWIFYVNELISLPLAAYFWIFFRHTDQKTPHPFTDKLGYFFFVLGIGSIVTGLTVAQEVDWLASSTFIMLMLIGITSFIFFILWELNHPTPLIDLRLFKNPLLSFSLLNLAVLFSSYFGIIILISLWLNIYVNYTPLWIALLIGIMAIAGIVAFLIRKFFLHSFDPRYTLAFAILSMALSCYYSTYFNVEVDFFHLAVARFLSGLGLVLFIYPLLHLSLLSHPKERSHEIYGLFQLTRALFSSLGAALYVILWQRRQEFFHERLGEGLNVYSQITSEYFQRAVERFNLTSAQATSQLDVFLNQHSTSLALNDVFGFMGYVLVVLFIILLLSFTKKKIHSLINP